MILLLHQGLSETILMNTLTDVREREKKEPSANCTGWQIWIVLYLYAFVPQMQGRIT